MIFVIHIRDRFAEATKGDVVVRAASWGTLTNLRTVMRSDGGDPVQLTERGSSGSPSESPDGKFVYYRMRRASIWRVPASGGTEEPAFDTEEPIVGDQIDVEKGGVYYLGIDRFERSIAVLYYDFGAKKTSEAYRLPGRNFGFMPVFSISPDGKDVLFARVDQSQTRLMLVENFR